MKHWKERRAYLVLVLISMMLSVAVYTANQVTQTRNEHKFCDIMNFSLQGPGPPKPKDPKAAPKLEHAYEAWQKALKLSHVLGCS